MVIREIHYSMREQYHAAGFVDDDPSKQGCSVHSVPVLGSLNDLPKLADRLQIEEIIIAIPSAEQEIIRKVSQLNFSKPVKLKVIPGMSAFIDGTADIKRFRDVQVEDLLGREPVRVNLAEVAAYLTGKRVLITGAGGSIGSELCRQVACFHPESLIMLGRGENSIYEIGIEMQESFPKLKMYKVIADIRDRQTIKNVFDQFHPHVVFHAAAHKHVPLMEDWPEEAFKNNILGTRNVAVEAHEHRCERFVMISTDKAIKPSSVMGATKRVAEMIIRALSEESATKFVAVRFGNVLGSRGSVVPLFKRQIERGGPITITHPDMKRYFMTIPEAAQLVIQAGAMGNGGEVFVLDMGEPVRIVELAENLIRLSGLVPGKDIPIVFTGVRAGEKLFEELLSTEEGTTATRHERIFVATLPNGIRTDLFGFLEEIERGLVLGKAYSLEDVLKELVRDYSNLRNADDEVAATSTKLSK
jgi:FlaA1/EpsC-like NDP-sugar epimerase